MARPPHHRRRRTTPRTSAPTDANVDPTPIDHPVFAQPQPTADPTQFRLRHPSDDAAYKTIDALNAEHKLGPMPFPAPRGGTEPILTLAQALGPAEMKRSSVSPRPVSLCSTPPAIQDRLAGRTTSR
jgi:hypothetical protein